MSDMIKKLVEKRTLQAAQKQISQKLRCIARSLGNEIIGDSFIQTFIPDAYEITSEDIASYDEYNLPDMNVRGYVYDTLKHGVNIEIIMMLSGDKVSEIKCSYNGNIAFHEEEGQLQAYAPDDGWETVIESQWHRAKKKELEQEKYAQINKRREDVVKKENLLQKLRRIWGL